MTQVSYEQAVNTDHLMSHAQFTDVLFPEIFTLTAPQGNELVLDLATGTGNLADSLAHQIKSGCIIGVGNSDAMLRVAREKAVKTEIPNYFPLRANAEDLIFKDSIFDLVFCVRSLHEFKNPMKMLKEAHRVLKADGHLLLCEPAGPDDERLTAALTEAFDAAHPGYKFFSAKMLDGLVSGAGFKEVRGTEAALAYHQEGLGGVPMGPHYMEAYHMIRMRKDKALLDKFNEQVFEVSEGPGGKIQIHGSLTFLISLLEKKPSVRS